ncbi:putative RNA-directed DNA polymerase [Tanacetum coccineum]
MTVYISLPSYPALAGLGIVVVVVVVTSHDLHPLKNQRNVDSDVLCSSLHILLPEIYDSFEGCKKLGFTEHLKRCSSLVADHPTLIETRAYQERVRNGHGDTPIRQRTPESTTRPPREVLDRMEQPVDFIIADVTLIWILDVANRRNIWVAAYWLIGEECIDYIPGLSPMKVKDFPVVDRALQGILPDLVAVSKKAQSLLLATVYELETEAIDAIKHKFQIPVYTIGPNIPNIQPKPTLPINEHSYFTWLNSKPPRSVLYISLGMGIKFEDEIQGLWLLVLYRILETFRTSLSNSAPGGVIPWNWLKGRSKSRGPSNRGNHHSSSSKGKFADVECYHCHKKGHTMKFCRQLKKENKKKNFNNQKNKHKKDDDGDDNIEVNTTTDEFFVCLDYDMVNLAHDDSRMIAGIGDICLKFNTGMELVLHNVKHVQMACGNYGNKRLGSPWSEKKMSILSKKNVLSGVRDINLKKCSHCLAGMQTSRVLSDVPSFRTENILVLVTLRCLLVPLKTKTSWRVFVFVTFIDDHSRKVCIVREMGLCIKDSTNDTANEWSWQKRIYKTLVEMSQCLLSHAGFACFFLGIRFLQNIFDAQFEMIFRMMRTIDEETYGAKHVDAQEQTNLVKTFILVASAYATICSLRASPSVCRSYGRWKPRKNGLIDAMQDEMKSLYETDTYDLNEARLVVKGFSQKKGIDFDEIFSPVVKIGSIRAVLGLAASLDLEVEQIDVKKLSFMVDLVESKSTELWFNMDKAKVISSPLTPNFKLIDKDCPSSKKNMPDLASWVGRCRIGSLFKSCRSFGKLLNGYFVIAKGELVSWPIKIAKVCGIVYNMRAVYVAARTLKALQRILKRTKRIDIRYHCFPGIRDAIVVASCFRRSPEFAPSDRHDFWTEASLHIKEGFDRWDLDFEAWKFCFLPGQIASCLVIFFLSCSLFVAIYLDIDSKIMMIVVCL